MAPFRDLFDTSFEDDYERCARLGADAFNASSCVVARIDGGEHHGGRSLGDGGHAPMLGSAFFEAVLASTAPVVALDATQDRRFRNDPLVVGRPNIRFFAATALRDAEGGALGMIGVMDAEPRANFTRRERRLLGDLAALTVALLEDRRAARMGRAAAGFATATAIAIVTADVRGRITFWNHAAEMIFNIPAARAIGCPLEIIVPPRFRDAHRHGIARLLDGAAPRLAGKNVEVIAIRGDGSEFPVEMTISTWTDAAGRSFGAQIQDITARRQREEALQHLARHDPMTGLTNRTGFREGLGRCLATSGRATLLSFDLDGFKAINDGFGHPVGDALLQAIAIRFASFVEDGATFARIGGDEFALVLPDRTDPLAAHALAEEVLRSVEQPFPIAGHLLQVGVSAGIAIAPLHAGDVDGLLLRADLALLAAKRDGGCRIRFFDNGMRNALAERRAFKDELRQATRLGQWELAYQPQVRLDDHALLGVEALLRWHHPTRGLLTPAAFLPVLETHSVAREVGAWVLDEACRQLRQWRDAGFCVPRVGVNVFAAQFAAGSFEQMVGDGLRRHGLAPSDLEIEVTETVALRPGDRTLAALHALRRAGLHIALDDFGTGFASLTTLKQLPVTRLKIDRSFVEDIGEASHSIAIVAAIVSLADRLGLEVIAEGIETPEQCEALRRLGCRAGQGFLFGKPTSARLFLPSPSRRGRPVPDVRRPVRVKA